MINTKTWIPFLFLLLVSRGLWAQGPAPEVDILALDSTEVLSLLDEAIRLDRPDTIKKVLERALRVSESITFDRGSEGAYMGLIRLYRSTNAVSYELRIRLKRQQFFEKRNRKKELTQGLTEIADLYFSNGMFNKAEVAYRSADSLTLMYSPENHYRMVRRRALSTLQVAIQVGLRTREDTLFQIRKIAEAQKLFESALNLARTYEKFDDQMWIHQQLGHIAHRAKDYDAELHHARSAYQLSTREGFENERMTALNNLGYAYKYANNYDSAMVCFRKVIAELPAKDNQGRKAAMEANLGILQFAYGNSSEAISLLTSASESYGELGKDDLQATTMDYLALVYNRREDYYNALQFNQKAIDKAKSAGASQVEASTYRTRSVIYQDLFEFEDALKYYKKYLHLHDSLITVERDQIRGILQQEGNLERLESELNMLYSKELLQEKEIERLNLENETRAKKAALLEKEVELTESDLRNTETQLKYRQAEAQRALNSLMLSEEQRKNENQQSEITVLNQENAIKELEVEKERLKADEKTQEVALLEKEKQVQDLKLAQRNSRIRNLIYLLLGMGILVLLVLVVLIALRRKNHIIAVERAKSDNLLLNILPIEVANELKAHGRSEPRSFDEVTVVFTDFAGFTQISEKLTPTELVAKLDQIFMEFDRIAEQVGLTRIKTIGDAYMAACGLPKPDAKHAEKSVRAALKMRDFIRSFNNLLPEGAPKWNIRIGLHTGPVVAGVVGEKKFAYDIWGDTVNTASRMESSGAIGKVNVSGDTFKIVENKFTHEYRGKVAAKNKGEIDMYFLENVG
jgi:class 3 adenylate cyclase